MRELYEADFHKPGIYTSGRVWANAWHVVFRAPSQGGRGRRAAVDFVVCFGWGDFFLGFLFSIFLFFERIQPAASMRPPCLIYLSTSTGVRTGCHHLISLSVCVHVQHSSFLLIARAVQGRFHKPGIYGSGRVWANAWDVFRCKPSRGVAGLLWISWCVLGTAFFFVCVFFFVYFCSKAHGLLQV